MSTQLPHEKGFHISWDQIHRDSRALAWRLDRRGPGEDGAWKAVVAITNEVERHANAIDPREVTAVSVLVDLVVELAQGMRHLANVMIKDDQPAAIIRDYPAESEWPASLMDPEVAA